MPATALTRSARCVVLLAAAAVLTGCDDRLVGPAAEPQDALATSATSRGLPADRLGSSADQQRTLATLRRVTARYHDLDAAIADGFILLHECEVRPGEGAVGLLYVHLGRYVDGILDPAYPDGLLYAPTAHGKPQLAGVELALPAAMWTAAEPPSFLGVPLQPEEEFGAFGLHVWVWRHNPAGMFAQAHPTIACEPTS